MNALENKMTLEYAFFFNHGSKCIAVPDKFVSGHSPGKGHNLFLGKSQLILNIFKLFDGLISTKLVTNCITNKLREENVPIPFWLYPHEVGIMWLLQPVMHIRLLFGGKSVVRRSYTDGFIDHFL